MREDYNRIIESLTVKFIRLSAKEVIRPVTVENYCDANNTLILLQKGTIAFEEDGVMKTLYPGDVLLMPSSRLLRLQLGSAGKEVRNNEEFLKRRLDYLVPQGHTNLNGSFDPNRTQFISFVVDVRAFDSVNFFNSLNIPAFAIREYPPIGNLLLKLYQEVEADQPGRERLIRLHAEEIILEIFRYIFEHKMFVEQLATNNNYFKDPRLLNLFDYIKTNLNGDLSNKILANIANVSEDYVGQYFKMLTGINPQDYIEYQRMERAVELLRTSKKSIRDIGYEVGYKDTAYFCRRFKMMFGISAGKMRRRETSAI